MSDYFLHETQAQLQLALFGMDEDFMDRTNAQIRAAFAGTNPDPLYVRDFVVDLIERMKSSSFSSPHDFRASNSSCPHAHAGKADGKCPHKILGPLSRQISTLDDNYETRFGNGLIFSFAGHDTTGHTLTFLFQELARNPKIQERLQVEVDDVWRQVGSRPLEYFDLTKFKFMTRCIHETLRMWPAVANGTFRVTHYDDYCHGENGEKVFLPKGTRLMLSTWQRHRNPKLWGPDVDTFNPDRDFEPKEIFFGKGLSGQNPSTPRFSPFTYGPRDCIGKNFAQMEMRAIVANVLKHYTVHLAPGRKREFQGLNRMGTMGARDAWGKEIDLPARNLPFTRIGLHCKLIPRS